MTTEPRPHGNNGIRRRLVSLHDDRGQRICLVDPANGKLYTRSGRPSIPVAPRSDARSRSMWAAHGPTVGNVRLSRSHAKGRRAADAAGITRSTDVTAWEQQLLDMIDGGTKATPAWMVAS